MRPWRIGGEHLGCEKCERGENCMITTAKQSGAFPGGNSYIKTERVEEEVFGIQEDNAGSEAWPDA